MTTDASSSHDWRIGELAAMTGLTVRTLHHYDHVGLVRPSTRTDAGYRLYDEADVQRLYEVLALRQLGLPLESIGRVLDAGTPIVELLDRHRSHVTRQLVALRTLRAQLGIVVTAAQGLGPAPVTDYLDLIRKVITLDDTVKLYFDDEQLATLAERRDQRGQRAMADVESAWPDLIDRVQRAVDAGLDPASPEAQGLAGEWRGLLEEFHGGDPNLRDSLYRLQADHAEEIEQRHGGPSPAMIDFITAANAGRT